MIRYRCSACGTMLQSHSSAMGKQDTCPACKKVIFVPEAASPSQAEKAGNFKPPDVRKESLAGPGSGFVPAQHNRKQNHSTWKWVLAGGVLFLCLGAVLGALLNGGTFRGSGSTERIEDMHRDLDSSRLRAEKAESACLTAKSDAEKVNSEIQSLQRRLRETNSNLQTAQDQVANARDAAKQIYDAGHTIALKADSQIQALQAKLSQAEDDSRVRVAYIEMIQKMISDMDKNNTAISIERIRALQALSGMPARPAPTAGLQTDATTHRQIVPSPQNEKVGQTPHGDDPNNVEAQQIRQEITQVTGDLEKAKATGRATEQTKGTLQGQYDKEREEVKKQYDSAVLATNERYKRETAGLIAPLPPGGYTIQNLDEYNRRLLEWNRQMLEYQKMIQAAATRRSERLLAAQGSLADQNRGIDQRYQPQVNEINATLRQLTGQVKTLMARQDTLQQQLKRLEQPSK